jgi:hypothetical protein
VGVSIPSKSKYLLIRINLLQFIWIENNRIIPEEAFSVRSGFSGRGIPKCGLAVAKSATLCLRLVVRIEELTLGRKVRQNVAS